MSNKIHFEGAPDWVASAGIVAGGTLCWYPVKKELLKTSTVGFHPPSEYLIRWFGVSDGYDDTDWESSLVDRGYED